MSVGDNPIGVAVSPDGSKVYVANHKSDAVSVIDTSTNNVTSTVNVGYGPWGVAVSPDGSKVYVTNAEGTVSIISTAENNVTATVDVEDFPIGVSVTPDGSKVYVTNSDSNNVSVIDTATNTVTATVKVGSNPVAFGQSIGMKQILIEENPVLMGENPVLPVASFSACPISGKAPLTVKFTDKSAGSPTSWHWSFGDKCTSTAQNPVHKYSKVGEYTVSLTVKNTAGCNMVKKTRHIIVKK